MLKNIYEVDLYSFKGDELKFNYEKLSKSYKNRVIDAIRNHEYKKIDTLIVFKTLLGNYKEIITKTKIPYIYEEVYNEDFDIPSIYYKGRALSEDKPIFILLNSNNDLKVPTIDNLEKYIATRKSPNLLYDYLDDKINEAIMTYYLWYYNKNDLFDNYAKILAR